MKTELVMVESPYASNDKHTVEEHMEYARKCMLDCIKRGESPFAMHLLYTQVLDDSNPLQRGQGIKCGLDWATKADKIVFYCDMGVSNGMKLAYKQAIKLNKHIVIRCNLFEDMVKARKELEESLENTVIELPDDVITELDKLTPLLYKINTKK